ncbi:MAG: cytochrome P450, partial [Pseudonocardiaceae bacterium]
LPYVVHVVRDGPRWQVEAKLDELSLGEHGRGGPPADFHTTVAFPLPALVVCELLGVPADDRADFLRWQVETKQVSRPAVARGGLQSLWRYLGTLIERKRWAGGDGSIISDLLEAAALDPELTDDGIAHLAAGLLFAGHAPVVAIIDRGVLLLLTHPEQREALRRDPALAAGAVEEIFRFASPIERARAARRGGLTRYAAVDIEVDAATIRAGDTVMFAVQEANEDASVFPDPTRFDITRERIPHLSLSHGAHFCLGAHLARMELQYLFVRLFDRFPTLRLAVPLEEIQPVREAVAGAVNQLPVTW